MAKAKTAYVCNDCGAEHSKWQVPAPSAARGYGLTFAFARHVRVVEYDSRQPPSRWKRRMPRSTSIEHKGFAVRPSTALSNHRDALRALSARYPVRNPRVFGSVVRGEDGERSDLDLLVDSTPDTTLLRLAELQIDAEQLLGVPVDVRTPEDLPARVRAKVLLEARPL